MKHVFFFIVGRLSFILIGLIAILFIPISLIAMIYAIVKMTITGKYDSTTSFRCTPTIEDGDACFFDMRVPIKNR